MPKKRSWTNTQLTDAVATSRSVREVIQKLNLVPAGGNYNQINEMINELKLDKTHFTGKGWNIGWTHDPRAPITPLEDILVENRRYQSHSLKKRLFVAGIKKPICELCGWCEVSVDGRTPIELDHINGNHADNRIENLRILCPNCHSLQPTHRGLNKKTTFINKKK